MEVKPGDLWAVGDQVYLAQTGSSGILLRRVITPEQLEDMDAVLIYRSENHDS